MKFFSFILFLNSFLFSFSQSFNCYTSSSSSSYDPKKCRMIINSETIYNLIPDNLKSGSGKEIIMKYDLIEDSYNNNDINKWNYGYDIYLKTSYDYTRWGGPLGM